MTQTESPAPRRSQRASKPQSPQSNVIGTVDLSAGMDPSMLSGLGDGIPDAMAEDDSWDRRSDLDKATPPPRNGYVHKWVRITTLDGRPDVQNKASSLREGWRFRQADSESTGGNPYQVFDAGPLGNVFMFGSDLVLAERPVEIQKLADKRLARRQAEMTNAVYNDMKNPAIHNIPARYGSLGFESDRDAADLID